MDSATANTLNSDRKIDLLLCRHSEITKQSTATMTVAGAGPNRRTEAKTNASETEKRASTDGTLIENEPVSRVSAARINH
jgi:hypothetical protein